MLSSPWRGHEQRAGRLAEAAAAYRKIVALRPDIAEAYNSLGNVLVGQGQLDEAAAQYRASGGSQAHALSDLQQSGQHPARAGQARPGRGALSASARRQARLCRRRTSTWATSCGSKANSTRPWHAISKRSPCDPILPSPTTTWAACSTAGQARRSGGPIRARAGSPARSCRGTPQPGQRPPGAGQARPGPGTLSSKRSLSGPTCRGLQQPRQRTRRTGQARRSRGPVRAHALALKPGLFHAHVNLGRSSRSRASSIRPRHVSASDRSRAGPGPSRPTSAMPANQPVPTTRWGRTSQRCPRMRSLPGHHSLGCIFRSSIASPTQAAASFAVRDCSGPGPCRSATCPGQCADGAR